MATMTDDERDKMQRQTWAAVQEISGSLSTLSTKVDETIKSLDKVERRLVGDILANPPIHGTLHDLQKFEERQKAFEEVLASLKAMLKQEAQEKAETARVSESLTRCLDGRPDGSGFSASQFGKKEMAVVGSGVAAFFIAIGAFLKGYFGG